MTLRKSSGVAVRAGDSVEIECQPLPSNDCSDCRLLEWSFTPAVVDAFDPLTLFNPEKGVHVNFSKRVSVSDRRSLKLSPVTPDDAGFFQCVLFCLLSSGIQGTCKDESELTVLLHLNCGPLLLLDSVAEGQNITVNCVIGYKGNWVPSLEWKTEEEEGEGGGEGGVEEKAIGNNLEYQASVASSTVYFTFNLITNSSMHGKKIGFKVYFDGKDYVGKMNRTSMDPPKYTHRWSSPTLNILYPPRNLTISADQGFYAGSVFTCSADANPEPGFHWKVLETGATFDRQTIRLLEEQLAGYSTVHLTCTAANQIANISRSIAVQKSNPTKSSLIAVIVISCVLLILLTIAVSYILYLKRKGEGHRMATEATGPASPPIPPVDQSPVPNNSESNSYTSVPSEVLSPEQETEISALYVQHLTSDSAEQLEGYGQLEAREQPAPNVYSRLKSVSSTRHLDSFADSGYYVNVTAS